MTTPFTTRLFTKFFGEEVGSDELGNRYYRCNSGATVREKRWVIYSGEPDGSAVPPEWQGWLTHASGTPPEKKPAPKDWMIDHKPNPTGTNQAYKPSGTSFPGHTAISLGSYEPWKPD